VLSLAFKKGQILCFEFQNNFIVSLVCISSGNSKISLLQAFQLNVKIRRNIREYNKEEA